MGSEKLLGDSGRRSTSEDTPDSDSEKSAKQ